MGEEVCSCIATCFVRTKLNFLGVPLPAKTFPLLKLIGPFQQIITFRDAAPRGPLRDEDLDVIHDGGILVENDRIAAVGNFEYLYFEYEPEDVEEIDVPAVAFPGFIDCHTHVCYAGTRVNDFAQRNAGVSYLDIARAGGGIRSTVQHTRNESFLNLARHLEARLLDQLYHGITTTEVKSGYGLDLDTEIRMLRVINELGREPTWDLVPTCLAAHVVPEGFPSARAYCGFILEELVPRIREEQLCQRFDIFVEDTAFDLETARWYLNELKKEGFELTLHGDQFTAGGSRLAVEVGARSVDHLEVSGPEEIALLARSETVPVVLPGASLGLGIPFAPARKILDAGCSLAIASDWNPGSGPMGNLTAQIGILAAYEKLTCAEVMAGITYRAARALGLSDRAQIAENYRADFNCYVTDDWREIVYRQGGLGDAFMVWKNGERVV